jgi:serine/threonine protein kinase
MPQYKPDDRIGGEYTVLKVFGGEKQSGMGVVYLVRDEEYKSLFVLKSFQRTKSEDAKRQFISEAHAWINAGAHPNLVQAYWVREIAEQLFVAAEYVEPDEEGRNNLAQFLNEGQLRPEIILLWAAQFCYGMDYALSKGVLAHRDIKPDNLMIDRTATLKVTDFGIAKSIQSDATTKRQGWWQFGKTETIETVSKTKTGSAMGTLPYMAPEQFIDAKSADHRSDIYSFGIILYQMATRNSYPYQIRPDSKDIEVEYFQAHLTQLPLTVESPFMPVITRCLEKKPELRYATYDKLLADLGVVAKNLHITLPKVMHVAKEDEELYAQAQSYVALGDKDRAMKAIDEYIARYAENACGWTEKGRLHLERGEYSQALSATKQSLEINPYNTHAWNNLGILLNRTNAPIAKVKVAFASALNFDPQNTAAMMNLIGPLILHNEYGEAAALTAKALKLRPDKPLVLAKAKALIKDLFESRDFAAAKTLLAGWTAGRPSDVDAWHNFGLIYQAQRDLDQAIDCFNHVHTLAPEDNFAVVQLAKLYFQQNKSQECIEFCNKLLQRKYESSLAVSLKARSLNLVVGYEQSLKFLQPYIDHNQNNDFLWVVLAEIHEYRDNYDAAVKALHSAKRLLVQSKEQNNVDNLRFVDEKLRQLSGVR